MVKKVLSLLNIHPDKNQRLLLISTAVSGLLVTYAHPTLLKAIISELPAQWLAFESVVMALSSLFIGMLWQGKIRSSAIRYFSILAFMESFCGFLLGLYLCFIEFNVWVYAIASLIYSAIISEFITKCIMAFKAKMWVEKDREVYDNNLSIVGGIVCVVGYLFAIIALPSLKLSLFLWAICCIIDDIGWIVVYTKNKESLKEC